MATTLLRTLVAVVTNLLALSGAVIGSNALFLTSAIGSGVSLALLVGYVILFGKAAGPSARAYLRGAFRDAPGFRTIVGLMIGSVVVIAASAFIGPHLDFIWGLLLTVAVLTSLQKRAEKHWYEWSTILAARS
ncbi:hypothetical protein [Frondihabitans sp. 762G35]|uniref:hypothetical protein n=1 Tax=Frondihabitans sp. 762G35 TaxID=1446794 RepID=UPI001C1F39E3|nr:hypothetical protein [Frondihabitans sp. 762G35]